MNESAYEYGFAGDLGVKGLNAYYFKSANKNLQDVVNRLVDAEANQLWC